MNSGYNEQILAEKILLTLWGLIMLDPQIGKSYDL